MTNDMTKRELSVVLRELACGQATPLCKEWTEAWSDDTDIDELLDKYVRGFDFAVKNDFPPLDFCRRNFDKDDLHRHHIYIDEEVDLEAVESGYYVFLGTCKGRLVVKDLKAVTVYVRHDSRIDVSAFDGAKVFVTYYDHSSGGCVSDGWSKIKRYNRTKK